MESVFYKPDAVKIYIDGSCTNNPGGQGGCAGIIEYPDDQNLKPHIVFQRGYKKPTTSIRMELRGFILAYRYIKDNLNNFKDQEIFIVTDLRYIKVHQKWNVYNWRNNDWTCKSGNPALNDDLWKQILSLKTNTKKIVNIKWIKGKSTVMLKNVDSAAKKAAQSPRYIDHGYSPGKTRRSKALDKNMAVPCADGTSIVRNYRHKPIGSEYKMWFDVYSAEKEKYTHKCYAYYKDRPHNITSTEQYRATFSLESDDRSVVMGLEKLEKLLEK